MINKIFLVLTFFTYSFFGFWAMFSPESYTQAIELSINTNFGSSEVRSVLGGINVFIALFSLLTLFKSKYEKLFFQFFLFVLSGILLGRLVTLFVGEFTSAFILGVTLFELVYFIFLLTALKKMEKNLS
ncbi:DUF4345 family protein [Gammaproteobacteria bacterium]|nr:DUF4345 family protein [Gammaproteobacteria bacterium]